MNVVRAAIQSPVTTTVGVIFLVLFGIIALFRLPVQLTPDVEEPEVSVSTHWFGASPHEVEREIIDEQEEQLKSLEGLLEMTSASADSDGTITLTFPVGTDIDAALMKVSNRLEQVPSYPEGADKPVIRSGDPNMSAIAWFILEPLEDNGFEGDISTLYDFADDFLKPEFERVPGVSSSGLFGGRPAEMHVTVDPAGLAARRITLNELGQALLRENRNFSAGDFDEGKRRFLVRTVGEYSSPEEIEAIVVAVRDDVPVYLRDVARAELGYRKASTRVFAFGRPVIAMNAVRETGANVLEVMTGLKERVAGLNAELLEPRGLKLTQAYDETDYIGASIDLVRSSLVIGAILAVTVLILFLRSGTSTFIVAASIPISIIGSFLMMMWFGRTLNVISLAGMAFAVGMIVDNSIVVLENIYRHRQMGKDRAQAAYDGTMQVWGAVLASTLTTIAVFVPVAFMREEAGQLFGDIAIAISCAVALSLVVSVTVIPSLSARILRAGAGAASGTAGGGGGRGGARQLWGLVGVAGGVAGAIAGTVHWITASVTRRVAVVLVLVVASISVSWLVMPKAEYLPVGNNNFVFGILLPPPGYNLDEVSGMQEVYRETVQPLLDAEAGSPEATALPGGGLRSFFFVATPSLAFMGARSNEPMRVKELLPVFQQASGGIPATIPVITQSSIFQRGLSEGRSIDIRFTGPELETLIGLGGETFGKVMQAIPGSQARPIPSLDLGNPEVHVITDRRRAAELGISNRDLGFTVDALVDGARAGEYLHEGKKIDLVVRAEESFAHRTHLLDQMPIATPDGRLVTLGSVAKVATRSGPVQINHSERQRSVVIQVTPPETVALEEAMDAIEAGILGPMRAQGRIGGLYSAELSGSADKLAQTGRSLRWNFLLALVITYLLMAALFESFLYPFVIMFSVPLAALGGFLGLAAVNLFVAYQPLDVLTMLGFIILVGTVVNNAILIVHQALNHMREDAMSSREAIRESVRTRVRPIFMSVGTSVFGMMPLVLFPGAGSELYRGLGGVVVGGLALSTVFTLFLVPAVFSLSLDIREAIAGAFRGAQRPAPPQAAGGD